MILFFKSICLCMQQLVLAVYDRFLNPRHKYYWQTAERGGGGGGAAGDSGRPYAGGAGSANTGSAGGRRAGASHRRAKCYNNGSTLKADSNRDYDDSNNIHLLPTDRQQRPHSRRSRTFYSGRNRVQPAATALLAPTASSAWTTPANEARLRECEQLLTQVRARKRARTATSKQCAF